MTAMSESSDVFKRNYLVVGLSEEHLKEVFDLATVTRMSGGEQLLKVGTEGTALYVIINGRANVLTADGDKLAEVGPGSVLGEISLMDARPCGADAFCVGPTTVASLPTKELRKLMSSNKELGFTVLANLSRVLCMRLRDANSKIDVLMDQVGDTWNNAL